MLSYSIFNAIIRFGCRSTQPARETIITMETDICKQKFLTIHWFQIDSREGSDRVNGQFWYNASSSDETWRI